MLAGVMLVGGLGVAHYEYLASAKKTSVLREAMFLFFEPRRLGANNDKIVPRRVCRHLLKPENCFSDYLFVTLCS